MVAGEQELRQIMNHYLKINLVLIHILNSELKMSNLKGGDAGGGEGEKSSEHRMEKKIRKSAKFLFNQVGLILKYLKLLKT